MTKDVDLMQPQDVEPLDSVVPPPQPPQSSGTDWGILDMAAGCLEALADVLDIFD